VAAVPARRSSCIRRYTRGTPPISGERVRSRAFVPPGGWERRALLTTLPSGVKDRDMVPVSNEGNQR